MVPKRELVHYINTRGRPNQQNNQNNQRGRAVSAADRIHVDHKTQGVNINNETQVQDNFISVEINMVPTIYNHVQQKTKFARNVQNADTWQKFVVLQK